MKLEKANYAHQAGAVEFDTSVMMEGGMKRVYFTRDRSGVVAFFKDPHWAQINRERLSRVVTEFNPAAAGKAHADYWREQFCWPSHLLHHSSYGPGLLLPVYSQDFFFKEGRLKGKEKDGGWYNNRSPSTKRLFRYDLIHASERGNLSTYLVALGRVARAVQKMHASGLAHSDLSERNVLVDPVSGKANIIDLDTLVVTGLYPPDVLGTEGFIAPEVMATRRLPFQDSNRKHPCAETDKHALAVLIHRFLLERHPLDGPRFIKGASSEDEHEALYGQHALYSEHRSDQSNRPKGHYLSAAILGKTIDDLFHKTFVDGLSKPTARPTANAWADALASAYDLLLACPNVSCSHRWFVLTDLRAPTCPYCGTRYRGRFSKLKLAHEGTRHSTQFGEVVLNGFRTGGGTRLYRHHTRKDCVRGAGQDITPVAEVVFLEKPAPTYYLKNLSLPDMQVRMPSGVSSAYLPLPIGQKLQLVTGLEIRFGIEPEALTGRVETFTH
jgi:serine/threonine protein kinase